MVKRQVAVIGAGIGGLAAALRLAASGFDVTVFERAAAPGGKMREVTIGDFHLDAGPTVFTMRWVFEELFEAAGTSFAENVRVKPLDILARHAWRAGERLDLYADVERTVDAIGAFAGAAEAKRYREFNRRAKQVYATLENAYIRSASPSPLSLMRNAGLQGLPGLMQIRPFTTLWKALGEYFHDARLQQLFGRYATYCGSSPFLAPATLMLIAHVEQDGVWAIDGGMHRLAQALADLAAKRGAVLRYDAEVAEVRVTNGRANGVRLTSGESIDADAVVFNADIKALAARLFGASVAGAAPISPRSTASLSALTWNLVAETSGFPLLRHNVFFGNDYAAEFHDIFDRKRLPAHPTVYVCAQDRDDNDKGNLATERLLCLVNAPAIGGIREITTNDLAACEQQTFDLLERCGLHIKRSPEMSVLTTPREFDQLFPATNGALYGAANHGWQASFGRPGARSKLPGLYLAGGSVHPGPGVPMAALSGQFAAMSVMQDLRKR
jgi:1-hydroxycarotenoid 3,4-desaturase